MLSNVVDWPGTIRRLPLEDGLAAQNGRNFWAYALAVLPDHPQTVLMAGDAELLRSTDGGRSWSFVFGDLYSWGGWISSILFSRARSGRAWVGGTGAFGKPYVLRLDPGSDTVAFFRVHDNVEVPLLALAQDPHDPGVLWAGLSGGVIPSDDGGETWGSNFVFSPTDQYGEFGALAVRGNHLFAAAAENIIGNWSHSELRLYSTSDGQVWDTLVVPNGAAGAQAMIVDANGELVIGTTHSVVWRAVF